MKSFMLSLAAAVVLVGFSGIHEYASSLPAALTAQTSQETETFSGTVLRKGDSFVLSDPANKISYVLDDAQKASEFEGKKVKVTGTVDAGKNILHIETITEVV
jgi:uncharacterized protein YdeI (BOF family)